MAHEGFGKRFYSYRKPMWHHIGVVSTAPMSAKDAAQTIGADYVVRLEDLVTVSGVPIQRKAIIRPPTADDPETRCFGVVGNEYTLVSPDDLCSIWDDAVGLPVETMGALYHGALMFITAELTTFEVRGDSVVSYLIVENPMVGAGHPTSRFAAEARVSYVRVVCANTLRASRLSSAETYRIPHDHYVVVRMKAALSGVAARAHNRVAQHAELFRMMASKHVTEKDIQDVLEALYPTPSAPARERLELLPQAIRERREMEYAHARRSVEQQRALVRRAFEGEGVGMDHKATRGTAWGLYNAVAEVEQYARVNDPRARAHQIMDTSARSARIERAFELLSR